MATFLARITHSSLCEGGVEFVPVSFTTSKWNVGKINLGDGKWHDIVDVIWGIMNEEKLECREEYVYGDRYYVISQYLPNKLLLHTQVYVFSSPNKHIMILHSRSRRFWDVGLHFFFQSYSNPYSCCINQKPELMLGFATVATSYMLGFAKHFVWDWGSICIFFLLAQSVKVVLKRWFEWWT